MSAAFSLRLASKLDEQKECFNLKAGEIHVWSMGLEQWPEMMDGLPQLLPAEEWDLCKRFEQVGQARLFLLRRILLRQLLSKYANCGPLDIGYAIEKQGKPKATGPATGIGFNASRSASRVLFAFGAVIEVGVDIEEQRWRPGLDAVAARYFNPIEQAQLVAAPELLMPKKFFSIWTRKEAETKLTGRGLAGFDELTGSKRGAPKVVLELPVPAGFSAHLAVERGAYEIKVINWAPDWN